jgi:hypothetical protein
VGAITPTAEHSEGPAWASTAWLLADFLDFAADDRSATAKLTGSLFTKLLVEYERASAAHSRRL